MSYRIGSPSLSPVSIALRDFRKPKRKADGTNEHLIRNPLLPTGRDFFGQHRMTRKRKHFDDCDYPVSELHELSLASPQAMQIDDEPELVPVFPKRKREREVPPAKFRKFEEKSPSLSIGKHVKLRFRGGHICDPIFSACVVLSENFGFLVMIKEESPSFPNIRNLSRYWACWKGTMYSVDVPLLDVIHSAD